MTIRKATIEDSKVLSSLILEASESVRESDFSAEGWRLLEETNTVEAFEHRFDSDNYFALIYQTEGRAVGYIAMIDFEKIDHMFVLPGFRRLGISAGLWKQAMKVCEKSGHGSYYWVRSSTVAEHAYTSFGFRTSGERQTRNGISSQLMEMGATVDIRQVGLSSAVELSELCSTSFADAYRGVDSDENIRAYCEKNYSAATLKANLANPDVIYKVAYRKRKAVGFFMVHDHKCPFSLDGKALELKQVYVLAGEFGGGLGKLLLNEATQCAHRLNKKWVWLCVSDVNTRAIAFYEKNGFELFGSAPVLEVGSSRLSASVMKLAL